MPSLFVRISVSEPVEESQMCDGVRPSVDVVDDDDDALPKPFVPVFLVLLLRNFVCISTTQHSGDDADYVWNAIATGSQSSASEITSLVMRLSRNSKSPHPRL